VVYCSECGSEIKDTTQNFCEKCGAPIPEKMRQVQQTSAPAMTRPTQTSSGVMTLGFKPYNRPSGLFDINRNYYVLKEKYWDI